MTMKIHKFVFSPFQENTYVIEGDGKEAIIIDPGMYYQEEKENLQGFIHQHQLKPVRLINTHCHLDHVFGNAFVYREYGLQPEYHVLDEPTMALAPKSAELYGIPGFDPSPEVLKYLESEQTIKLGNNSFEIRFCPGHAPGHIVLINHEQKIVIGGDVLFKGSIGRTDLPGGNYDQLIESIKSQLFDLQDDFVVYSGHGEETTIGYEKKHNPFLR